jgi:hypothetical protein
LAQSAALDRVKKALFAAGFDAAAYEISHANLF